MTRPRRVKSKEERLAEASDKFVREMEKTGLGVSIKLSDGPWVKVTDPPPGAEEPETA